MPQSFQVSGSRIAVIGVTGSGKTTTAARLSRILGIPHVELDALHWLPGWVQMDLQPFRVAVADAVAGPAWVTDGNYSKARDLIWEKAVTLVWLDYPLLITLWQLFARTIRRIRSRDLLWGTNQETWRGTFLSRDSLFLWVLQTHPRYRRAFPVLFKEPRYAHLQIIRFTRPRQTNAWLDWLASTLRN